jgi:hypothetical protein
MKRSTLLSLACIITFVWVGFLAAISFMEAPVKFTAPSLTIAVGLDVGRHVFAALNKVEWVFIALSIILLFAGKSTARIKVALGGVLLILSIQTFWLLPALDARALVYINGSTPPASRLHLVYIVVEAVKLIGLITTGLLQITAFRKTVQTEMLEQANEIKIDVCA